MQVKDVGVGTGINQRTLSDYLAGRKPIIPRHCALLSEYLQVPPAVLLGKEPQQGNRGEMQGNRGEIERERRRSDAAAAARADAISRWLSSTDF